VYASDASQLSRVLVRVLTLAKFVWSGMLRPMGVPGVLGNGVERLVLAPLTFGLLSLQWGWRFGAVAFCFALLAAVAGALRMVGAA
jgi:hypothetical protein